MATVKGKITLTSTDLLTDSLEVVVTKSITATHTGGLARAAITSTAKATASGQVTLTTAGEFTSPNYLYVKNTDATDTDYITVFDDAASGDPDVMYLAGGDWAFLPIMNGQTFKCYAATSGTVVEWMQFGTNA